MRKLLLICLALCVMFMMVGVTFAEDSTTVNGYVSDSKCGVKGANAKSAECTKKCVKAGEKLVVVTDEGQKVLAVDNPDTLTYRVKDARGGFSAAKNIAITVINGIGQAQSITVSGDNAIVTFAGIPGVAYDIQRLITASANSFVPDLPPTSLVSLSRSR